MKQKKKDKEKKELIKNKVEENPILKEIVEFDSEDEVELLKDISTKELNK